LDGDIAEGLIIGFDGALDVFGKNMLQSGYKLIVVFALQPAVGGIYAQLIPVGEKFKAVLSKI
jgi:hypothetical protein